MLSGKLGSYITQRKQYYNGYLSNRRSTFSLTFLRIPSFMECDAWLTSQEELKTVLISLCDDHRVGEVGTWFTQPKYPGKNVFLVKSRGGWPSDLIALPDATPQESLDLLNVKALTRFFVYSQFVSVFYLLVSGGLSSDSHWKCYNTAIKISSSFPGIRTLVLAVEDEELEQHAQSIVSIISLFPKLQYLHIRSLEGSQCKFGVNASRNFNLAQAWISHGETLQSVIFPDMTKVCRSGV
jgi:hypothetical protein